MLTEFVFGLVVILLLFTLGILRDSWIRRHEVVRIVLFLGTADGLPLISDQIQESVVSLLARHNVQVTMRGHEQVPDSDGSRKEFCRTCGCDYLVSVNVNLSEADILVPSNPSFLGDLDSFLLDGAISVPGQRGQVAITIYGRSGEVIVENAMLETEHLKTAPISRFASDIAKEVKHQIRRCAA